MALKKWFVKHGHVYALNNRTDGSSSNEDNGFDLLKWLKNVLSGNLNVQYSDNCCNSADTTTTVRFNITSQKLEYFNPANATWTEAPSTSIT